MKDFKGTKGEWSLLGELDDLRVGVIESENPKSCDKYRNVANIVCAEYEIPDYDEHAANARLISAAPDLLESLNDVSELLELFMTKSGCAGQGDGKDRKADAEDYGAYNALENSRKAINKALGI